MTDSETASAPAAASGEQPPAMVITLPAGWWRIVLLAVGGLVLFGTVIFVPTMTLGLVGIAMGSLALLGALWHPAVWTGRRSMPHVLVLVLVALASLGLCASQCGTYAFYDTFLGLPTPAVAIAAHALVAGLLAWEDHTHRDTSPWGDLGSAALIGVSLFYATVLITSGSWCGSCMAGHALMGIQGVALLRQYRGRALVVVALAVACGALGVNAVYHHRPAPQPTSDPDALVTYLRSLRPGGPVPVVEQVTAREADDLMGRLNRGLAVSAQMSAALDGQDQHKEGAAPMAPAPTAAPTPAPRSTPVQPDRTTTGPTTLRPIAMAGRWGKADAAIAMVAVMDMACPACKVQMAHFIELRDLVDSGVLQMRFLVTYRNDASQAAASLVYAAGLRGEQHLLDTMIAFYNQQANLLQAPDAVAALPASFPKDEALAILRQRKGDITNLLADAVSLRDRLGATTDPAMFLFTKTAPTKTARSFVGLTQAALLRAAIGAVGAGL